MSWRMYIYIDVECIESIGGLRCLCLEYLVSCSERKVVSAGPVGLVGAGRPNLLGEFAACIYELRYLWGYSCLLL